MRRFVILLAMVAGCIALWDAPLNLGNNAPRTFSPGLYVNKTSNNGIALISEMGDNYQNIKFGAKEKYPNKTLSPTIELNSSDNPLFGQIKNSRDGKNLYAVHYGPRKNVRGKCDNSKKDGCFEVYFRESSNGVLNFSKQIRINRKDMDDPLTRWLPKLVYIEETKRIFIFYTTNNQNTDRGFAYVTRPADSTVFTAETFLFRERSISSFTVAYTYSLNRFKIHIVWDEIYNGIFHLFHSSTTNLVKWTIPTALSKSKSTRWIFPNFELTSNTATSPESLYLTFIGEDDKPYLLHSDDEGETWSERISVDSGESQFLAITQCGDSGFESLFIVGAGQNRMIFSIYNIASRSLMSKVPPFESTAKVTIPAIACNFENKTFHLVSTVLTTDDRDDLKNAYISSNDFSF